jgi:hypothetical protein
MVAITKQSNDLLLKLQQDYPDVSFIKGSEHKWSPSSRRVYYRPLEHSQDTWSLLHELSHALLNHITFAYDIELLGKEVEAWQYAKDNLAPCYSISIPRQAVDNALETYREWLYTRSTCPECAQTGQQTKTDTYQCLNCRCLWRVNDARRCRLQRVKLS